MLRFEGTVLYLCLALGLVAAILAVRFRRQLSPFATWIFQGLNRPLSVPHLWSGILLEALLIVAYLGTNVIVIRRATSQVTTLPQIAIINMTPLFLGGRTNPIVDYLRVSLRTYHLGHHAAGRVVSTLGTAHSITAWSGADNAQRASGLALVTLLGLACITSLRPFRSLSLFSNMHALLSFAVFGILTWHIYLTSKSFTSLGWVLIYVSGLLWLVSQAIRLLRWRRRGSCEAVKSESIGRAVRARVRADHSIPAQPGSYFYVFLPHLPLPRRFRSRLAPITWWDPQVRGSTQEFAIVLPKEWASGLSENSVVHLDGPYGKDIGVEQYETVILAADGVGISGVLPFALSVMSRQEHDREDKAEKLQGQLFCDMTRKVTIFWKLDRSSQIQLVSKYFEELIDLAVAKALIRFVLFVPRGEPVPEIPKSKKKEGPESTDPMAKHFLLGHGNQVSGPLASVIRKETSRTPGKNIILACGSSDFTRLVRRLSYEHTHNGNILHFHELEYKPCVETAGPGAEV